MFLIIVRVNVMALIRKDQFTGSNNIAKPERLPEGAVVDSVNMDFTVGGKAERRAGYTLLRECDEGKELRAVFAMPGDSIALVENNKLIKVTDDYEEEIAEIDDGIVAATQHNNKLYINTESNSLEVGDSAGKWHDKNPEFDLSVHSNLGQVPEGRYRIGVTKLINGKESGSNVIEKVIGEKSALEITFTDDGEHRVYCSNANGSTMYFQGETTGSYSMTNDPVENSLRLESAWLQPFPFCTMLDSHNGRIVGANGRFLYFTRPMQPHLHHPAEDYLQFPTDITVIASVANGIYICADKTYFVSAIGSNEMMQRVVLEFGAVKGTTVRLPDTSIAWFTKYGQVLAGASGEVRLLNQGVYSPDVADNGTAGFIEHNGNQMITTTMKGDPQGSQLKSTDYWDLEVI